ncbi:serine/threonine-protein phosphatase 1 regulatory subunit 10-like isoform X2 [Asterias rubens]|uniref:serine/threonine-protein phosphatase 1 regulatory subunit 10-like isoform X2 n=1 Tax=Asterias rubens TaxID=7604 RepID=UPI001455A3CF|nr:serine/threonine-protein phosphatase 1 regulatory subunit 10-like isoform X2 [Asterias rubens]
MTNAVDPYQLLKALAPLLTQDGAMKNKAQVPRISGLMNGARKLVSRCIYVNILRSTNDADLLSSFIHDGGWELLNLWLQESKESTNSAFMTDLLKVFKKLPVTIDILKKSNTAKLVKQMSKSDADEKLKLLAEEVVSEWMKVIKQSHETADSKPAASSVVKKKKKLLKKPAKTSRENSTEDGSNSPMEVTTNKKSSEKPGENSKSNNNIEERTSKKSRLSLKKPAKVEESNSNEVKKEEDKVRTGKIKRPAHTKFRSTGLEKETTLPPIKIKKKNVDPPPVNINRTSEKAVPVKREGPIFGKTLLPPEKKPKLETTTLATTKTSATSTSSSASSTTSTSPLPSSNNHGRIKLIPPKHKQVQESSNFMDALNAPAIPVRKVKMKKPKPTSPTTNKHASNPLDSLIVSSKGKDDESEDSKEAKVDPPKFRFYSSGQNEDEESDKSEKTETKDETNSATAKDTVSTSNLKLVPSKNKKCVKWRDEDKLVDVRYFEMDETERVNVNRPKDFRDAAHHEMVMEREAMKNAKLVGPGEDPGTNGGYTDLLPWRLPSLIRLLDMPVIDYGTNSVEKGLQKQREMIVLQEIYFDKKMIPETPKEPDPEPFEPKEPTRIPLEDETADSSQSTPLYSEPMLPHLNPAALPPLLHGSPQPVIPPGITLPPGLQLDNLPPAIASLVQQIPGGLAPALQGPARQGPGRPNETQPPNATITNVQNLLNSIMGNQPGEAQPSQDELTNKLRDMLEPFKSQLPGSLHGPPQPNHAGGPNFGPEGPNFGPDGPNFGADGPSFGADGPNFGPDGPNFGPDGPNFGPDGPNFGPEGWGPRGPPPGHGPGPMRGRGGVRPPFPGPGRGFYNGPQFPNGPHRFPGPGGPDMGPRGPPRGPPRGAGPRGRGRGRGGGGMSFSTRPVCRHFMTPRGCERAVNCQFYHPGVNGPPLTE